MFMFLFFSGGGSDGGSGSFGPIRHNTNHPSAPSSSSPSPLPRGRVIIHRDGIYKLTRQKPLLTLAKKASLSVDAF